MFTCGANLTSLGEWESSLRYETSEAIDFLVIFVIEQKAAKLSRKPLSKGTLHLSGGKPDPAQRDSVMTHCQEWF